MVLLDVVYLSMNRNKSYENVTPKPTEGITREIGLHTRYYNLVFIGLLFSKMPISLSYLVMNDTPILHHVFILIFIALWIVISLYDIILMPFLSYFASFA